MVAYTSSLTRRTLLQSAPLGVAALATLAPDIVAAREVDIESSELMRLFHEWDACDRAAWDVENDGQSDAICDRMRRLELEMMATPATTAAELAAKIIAFTSYGDWTPSREFVAEAARLCGASRSSGSVEPVL